MNIPIWNLVTNAKVLRNKFGEKNQIYVLDVLWGQPIKLIQVVSTSEFHEYWWNDVDFIFLCPLQLVQGLRSNNIK